MKLKVEKWIAKSNFTAEVMILLNDSIKCYKADAYRASLLFSYLAFITILKERIGVAEKPANYLQHNWNVLRTEILNEDKWERAVYDATQQKGSKDPSNLKDPVFSINDALRTQIEYWKDRRNDCAHFKNNEITNAHVETFWSFLESNLYKITVEGGMNSLLIKIKRHYDTNYTRTGEDVTPLVNEITSSVELNELPGFWHNALQYIDNSYTLLINGEGANFITKVLALSNSQVTDR
jgi:hypothetical protein